MYLAELLLIHHHYQFSIPGQSPSQLPINACHAKIWKMVQPSKMSLSSGLNHSASVTSFNVELNRIREPRSKDVKQGRHRNERCHRIVKRRLLQLCHCNNPVSVQQPVAD